MKDIRATEVVKCICPHLEAITLIKVLFTFVKLLVELNEHNLSIVGFQ
uniref:Uncharacterized protein n=1 Tax=Arundo donax TaxID=35708 RepID=A0A0A8YX69_ARUDO